MLGIENLKQVIVVAANLGKQIEVAVKGGLKLIDLLGFVDDFTAIGAVIKNKEAIVAEFKDLDDAERAELLAYVKQNLDLENDGLEDKIEKSLTILVDILDFVGTFKKPEAPTA
jgi:hypothetical protein